MATVKKPDRRAERTRDALLTAFRDIVLERGYEGVAVLDVIERANVGRSTFYEHFENKDHIFRQSMQPLLGTLAGAVDPNNDVAKVTMVLEHFWRNRRFARVMLSGTIGEIVASFLAELLEEQLTTLNRSERIAPLIPIPLAAAHLAAGQLALVQKWAGGKVACPASSLAEALCESTAATARVLTRCSHRRTYSGQE
jgi:AcrR family transcriptional regulator